MPCWLGCRHPRWCGCLRLPWPSNWWPLHLHRRCGCRPVGALGPVPVGARAYMRPPCVVKFTDLALAFTLASFPAAFALAAEEVWLGACALALALGDKFATALRGTSRRFMPLTATVAAGRARAGFSRSLGGGAQELRVPFSKAVVAFQWPAWSLSFAAFPERVQKPVWLLRLRRLHRLHGQCCAKPRVCGCTSPRVCKRVLRGCGCRARRGDWCLW